MGVNFEMLLLREGPGRDADFDESEVPGETPREYVVRVARLKAEAGWLRLEQRRLMRHPVLAADTTVALGDTILAKPKDREDAVAMLKQLSGTVHHVYTALAIKLHDSLQEALSVTEVRFRELSDDEIRRYTRDRGAAGQGRRIRDPGQGINLHRVHQWQLHRRGRPADIRDRAAAGPFRLPAPVNEEILINVTPQETRVAVMQQGVVQELHVERSGSRGLVGNICLGEVSRVLPGMQSAFIQIGLDRAAFLHVADIWGHRQNHDEAKPIERILHDGQKLLVQVIKDPIGTKGARLSTQVSIAGRLLVYLPQESHIGISQRIEDEAERALLREKLQHLIPEDEPEASSSAPWRKRRARKNWAPTSNTCANSGPTSRRRPPRPAAPALLYQDLTLNLRVLRDFVNDQCDRVLVDSRETFQRMQAFANDYTLSFADRIQHYSGDRPLFDLYGVEDEIERALARRVPLKSGGYLIIDQTEALTTIDVNTGGFVGGRTFDDTIFKTNLEAAQVIARQLRLRNLGGIIILDFIDMDNEVHRDAVLSEFKKALALDRTRMTVNGFTQLGLVEMTRKRTRESLAHILCEPCPTCQGRGEIKTAQTICYEILRELLREARQFDARAFRILASQMVIDMFLDEESQSLAMLEEFIGKPISLQVETIYTQEQYDIVLV